MILFGSLWTAFTSLFVVVFLGPLLVGKEVHFESNGVPTVASPDNLGPIVVPAIVIGLFVLIGLGMLGGGLVSVFRKGGYFVGTPLRLVHYYKGTIRSIDWEQFSGDIELRGTKEKGTISMKMRSGKMVSRKNGPDRYVPDVIHLSGIPNAFEVEKPDDDSRHHDRTQVVRAGHSGNSVGFKMNLLPHQERSQEDHHKKAGKSSPQTSE